MKKTKLRKILAEEGLIASRGGLPGLSRLASSPRALVQVLQGYGFPPREAKQVAEAMVEGFRDLASDAFEEAAISDPEVLREYTGTWYGVGRPSGGGWHNPPEYVEEEGKFEYDGEFEYAGSVKIDTRAFVHSLTLPSPLKKQLLRDKDAFGDYLDLNADRLLSAMMEDALRYWWKKEWEESFKDASREAVEEGAEYYDLPLEGYADFEIPSLKCAYTHDANVTSDHFLLDVTIRCKAEGVHASGTLRD